MATSKVVEVAHSARALRKMGKQTTVFAHLSVSHGRAVPLGFVRFSPSERFADRNSRYRPYR